MSSSATFKINSSDNNEIRRVTLAEPSWTNFVAFVTKSNDSQQQQAALSKVSISYLDEEGDKICVSSEVEFAEALIVQAAKSVKAFSIKARDQKSCHRKPFGKGCPRFFSFGTHPLFAAANLSAGQPSRSTASDSNNNNNNNNNNSNKECDIDMEGLAKVAQEFFKNMESHTTKKDDSPAESKDGQKEAEGSANNQQKELNLKGVFEEFTKAMGGMQSALPQVVGAFSSVMESLPQRTSQSQNQNLNLNFGGAFEPLNDLVKNLFSPPSFGASASSPAQAPESSEPKEEETAAKESAADQENEAVEPEQFAEELALLNELGFEDKQTNLSLLTSANGDLQTVINSLVDL